ncbi:putative patatin-like phospholipase [Haloarcula marismortui ATCC 43049]|uniref:Patatin-like phospholipase n=1 Tax=Haloarcula marismortui (strain ATCC 43049 / DSM 3752 / JCM 8966 / VKM B-1809) TaxID=272569 RepID=Q5V5G9_HALMA|nr:patatin-like phospholipase family protein [Haloarcula marismortui]AAV45233.1 putative patatin-like phospholipase [Haloarcula marismortui ATCC 43049]QCP93012.1 patatin-like phospholipase family protein [Haloarcula marismortui ATCC 43049]
MSGHAPSVAIACQGGGSHTAFTAGALKRLLPAVDANYELVGLSGTSGGALCAVTAWYGLLSAGPDRAADMLDDVWCDVAAADPGEFLVNESLVWRSRLQQLMFPIPEVSPYAVPGNAGQDWYLDLLDRHIDFDDFDSLAAATPPHVTIGAVDLNSGKFETFSDDAITPETVLASAAYPLLYEAVEMNDHWHWDGLFSQNPPVKEFLTSERPKPDELWVIQIEPQTYDGVPTSLAEITDRRQELSGNISLNQELDFIETVNDWVRAGYLPDEYRHVEIRHLRLARKHTPSSKVDRDPRFIEDLLERGEREADDFLNRIA